MGMFFKVVASTDALEDAACHVPDQPDYWNTEIDGEFAYWAVELPND